MYKFMASLGKRVIWEEKAVERERENTQVNSH